MTSTDTSRQNNHTQALIVLSTLFFIWGLLTVFSEFLVNEFKIAFELSYPKAILIYYIFFCTYFVISFPAGMLIDRVGYKNGIITGVLIAAVGCLFFFLAAREVSYAFMVLALFLVSTGVTTLQVGANSYVALVGMRGRGAQRLTLVQAFNSLGTVTASWIAIKAFPSEHSALDTETIKSSSAALVQGPYLILCGILILLGIFLAFSRLPNLDTSYDPIIKESIPARKNIFQFPHVVLGAISIFLYVGAEVGIFRYLLFKADTAPSEMAAHKIDQMTEIYWLLAMVGRFGGSYLLNLLSPRKLISIFSLAASVLVVAFLVLSRVNGESYSLLWLLVAVGLFNSVLFPCIFTMGIDGLGRFSEEASSLLITSIVGGAIIPFVIANLSFNITAFLIIIGCYLFIAFFGFRGSRYEKTTSLY